MEASASATSYRSNRTLGLLDLEQTDWSGKVRFDAERAPEEGRYRILAGAEIEQLDNRFTGILPTRNDIVDPDASSYRVESSELGTRVGGYGEFEWKWSRRVATHAGHVPGPPIQSIACRCARIGPRKPARDAV